MALTRAEAITASFPDAVDIRKHQAAIFPREGIFPDPITAAAAGIAFAGAGWAVSARAFVACLKRGGAPYTQTYGTALVSNDGVVAAAWTVGAAPGVGSRIDLLCIRARDTTQGDSASGAPTDGPSGAARTGFPEFLVVAGTPGTPGVAPAIIAGYQEVARITVSAGNASAAAATIVQTYAFAYVAGGPTYFRTTADLLAFTTAAYLHPGLVAIPLDAPLNKYTWDGAAWDYTDVRGTYAPTFTRLTIGNGAALGAYERHGKRVRARIEIKAGTTTTIAAASGLLTVGASLPFAGDAKYAVAADSYIAGIIGALDTGAAAYDGFALFIGSATEVALYLHGDASGGRRAIHATQPFAAVTTGDQITAIIEYDAA